MRRNTLICDAESCIFSLQVSLFVAPTAEMTLELTRVRMLLARSAYVSVLRDSSKATEAGLIWAIMTVRLFPPNESCQSKTSGGNILHE